MQIDFGVGVAGVERLQGDHLMNAVRIEHDIEAVSVVRSICQSRRGQFIAACDPMSRGSKAPVLHRPLYLVHIFMHRHAYL